MLELSNALEAIRDFLELGGPVLRLIAWVILFMWILILERLIFFRTGLRALTAEAVAEWEDRSERKSWYAHEIRSKIISKVNMAANQGLPMIQTFVALCPLLGLLGTVTGMISVFEVMRFQEAVTQDLWPRVYLELLFQLWPEWLGHYQAYSW
jgi:biopolymer transport protein ExbB